MAKSRTALLVTYTMADPAAVGVFFRALRLSRELHRRGWTCVVFNYGPIPDDPKVDESRGTCEIIRFDSDNSQRDLDLILGIYRRIAPGVVLFGEYPLHFMEPLLLGARLLVTPPVLVLDQYYGPDSGAELWGVDVYLVYGVGSLWTDSRPPRRSLAVIPPFIDLVTPKGELPVPAALAALPWMTIVGFDPRVMCAGIELLARLCDVGVAGVVLSHDPAEAARLMREAGVPNDRAVALPLQHDGILFGLIAASRVVVLANGFMQLAEAVALGCPALSIRPKVYQPARPLPSWTSHGHTACGGAAMVMARVATKSGAATTTSPAMVRATSASVAPQCSCQGQTQRCTPPLTSVLRRRR